MIAQGVEQCDQNQDRIYAAFEQKQKDEEKRLGLMKDIENEIELAQQQVAQDAQLNASQIKKRVKVGRHISELKQFYLKQLRSFRKLKADCWS